MAPLPFLPEPTYTTTLSAGPPPRSSTLPLPLPVKSLIVQRKQQTNARSEAAHSGVVAVDTSARKKVHETGVIDEDANCDFHEETTNTPDIANPYNLISAEKPEELFSVGETFTDTTLSFMLSGRINAEQVSHLTHLFRQTICCDLEACIRAGRSAAPGIYAPSSSGCIPSSSSPLPLGNFLASDRLPTGGAKRYSRRGGGRCGASQTSQRGSSSLSCWKLKEGKCISFKREDAYARLLLTSATIITRGLVLSCRRPLIIADVNEHQCVSQPSFARR